MEKFPSNQISDLAKKAKFLLASLDLYNRQLLTLTEERANEMRVELAEIETLISLTYPAIKTISPETVINTSSELMVGGYTFSKLDQNLMPILVSTLMILFFLISIYGSIIVGYGQDFAFNYEEVSFLCPFTKEC